MALNKGKIWEKCVKESWESSFPNSFILRLPDQQNGYFGTSRNISDFIAFKSPYLFLIECKTINGNTLPFSNLKQYEKMLNYQNIPNVKLGFLVWWQDKNVTAWVPLDSVTLLKEENKKSIHVDYVIQKLYDIVQIPNIIKRVYPKCDLSVLMDGQENE